MHLGDTSDQRAFSPWFNLFVYFVIITTVLTVVFTLALHFLPLEKQMFLRRIVAIMGGVECFLGILLTVIYWRAVSEAGVLFVIIVPVAIFVVLNVAADVIGRIIITFHNRRN